MARFRVTAGSCVPALPLSVTMATFIMLATLTPEGVRTVKNNPERIMRSIARSNS